MEANQVGSMGPRAYNIVLVGVAMQLSCFQVACKLLWMKH